MAEIDDDLVIAPGSPGGRSQESTALSVKQYFLVNLSKLIIEFGGSFTLCVVIYSMHGRLAGILLSLWILTLFFVDLSGAHFNPCITLAVMFRRKSAFGKRRLKGLFYIVA